MAVRYNISVMHKSYIDFRKGSKFIFGYGQVLENDKLCLIPYGVPCDPEKYTISVCTCRTFTDLLFLYIQKIKETKYDGDLTIYDVYFDENSSLVFAGPFYKKDNIWYLKFSS